ncbi:fasciclin-like arabinogalactan protein 12 [Humulus lupulus]|uniref:fasciclin-like arabinogalactan protein 12 n=1 Tax=Humulus lupulus TaxID=3486 RepID=UPI002B407F58|nr:fasciclin-like arabinogalactan protein 12 [Humulus lupulus]
MMLMKQALIYFSFLLLCFYDCDGATLAHSPAQAPSKHVAEVPAKAQTLTPTKAPTALPVSAVEPPSQVPLVQAPPHKALFTPTDVTKILEKAGIFSVFIRLLKSTSVSIQIENQLNVSNTLTIFAPTNGAFAALKPGTLNTLSTEDKVQLVQYHILPSVVSLQNFQTLSNPVRTQASNTNDYPLNVIVEGSIVNISTGIVNTTISGTVYEDNQLAIYKVDKVLLPLGIFAPKPKTKQLAPTPTPAKPSKSANLSSSSSSTSSSLPSEESLSPNVAEGDKSKALAQTNNGVIHIGVVMVTLISMWGYF